MKTLDCYLNMWKADFKDTGTVSVKPIERRQLRHSSILIHFEHNSHNNLLGFIVNFRHNFVFCILSVVSCIIEVLELNRFST